MPGARWNTEEGCWQVSLAPQDRPRLLEAAEQLGLEVAPALRQVELGEAGRRAQEAGLYPFQVAGVEWLAGRQRALLADEMGLGKTAQALLALPPGCPALVICPASLKYNWVEEAHRWRPEFTPVVLEGKGSFRLPQPGELVVVNYQLLPDEPSKQAIRLGWCLPDLDEVCLVLDEAHMAKNSR